MDVIRFYQPDDFFAGECLTFVRTTHSTPAIVWSIVERGAFSTPL